jgi:methionyl-tRNA formyltransferase
MRVLFFGTPAFAAPTLARLLESSHEVVGVVTQPDRARGRGHKVTFAPVKALATERGFPVYQPATLRGEDVLATLRAFNSDIAVVAAYGKLLPQAVLDVPPHGMINVHASLLPRWRGAAPIHRAVVAGDTRTGVTIMRVVLALDAGPMLSHVEVPIGENTTSVELEATLASAGGALLVDTLDRMARGDVRETPQDEARVTYAAKLERHESAVDWSRPADVLHNQIRGLQPWPAAAVMLNGRRVILRGSVRYPAVPDAAAQPYEVAAPGTILAVQPDAIIVATGRGQVALTALQPEGRGTQSAREFANGARVAAGDRFTAVPAS